MKKRLVEAAVGVEQAKAQGLALKASGPLLVLYDPNGMLSHLGQEDIDPDALADNVYGFIEVKKPGGRDKCWDAYMVRSSAAQKGYGPLMYDVAMQIYGKIMPDRNQVTDAAENLWNYYINKRSDVQKFKFDDVTAPDTPDNQDDCTLHYDRDVLNYAISGGSADATPLRQNHEKFLKTASQKLGGESADGILDSAADAFFRKMY